jgi:hypothetical protein
MTEFEKTVDLKKKMRSRKKNGMALVKDSRQTAVVGLGKKTKTVKKESTINWRTGGNKEALAAEAVSGSERLTNRGTAATKITNLSRGRVKAIDQVYNDQDEIKADLKKINKPQVKQVNETWFRRGILFLVLIIVGLIVYGLFFRSSGGKKTSALTTGQSGRWYMVKLVDGEIFYGQISDTAADPIVIRNVYYDYDQVKGDKKEKNQTGSLRLVKRGKETYGPSGEIEIVRTQVLFMEPLREDSKVLKAIREYEK